MTTEVLQGWLLSGSTLWMLVDAPTEGALCDPVKMVLPTRLETRTKESNVHASMPAEKLTCAMKVSDAKRKQQHRPTMIINERFEYERVR